MRVLYKFWIMSRWKGILLCRRLRNVMDIGLKYCLREF